MQSKERLAKASASRSSAFFDRWVGWPLLGGVQGFVGATRDGWVVAVCSCGCWPHLCAVTAAAPTGLRQTRTSPTTKVPMGRTSAAALAMAGRQPASEATPAVTNRRGTSTPAMLPAPSSRSAAC